MAPPRRRDEEESSEESSSEESTRPDIARRSKFDDEEGESDAPDDWDAAEDSEVEREKAKKAAEAKAKADAAAALNKKSKAQRVEEKRMENMRRKAAEEEESSSEEEDPAVTKARARQHEQDSDLKHAEDLMGDVNLTKSRADPKTIFQTDPKDPSTAVNLAALPLFNPNTKDQFLRLREALVPLLTANSKKAQYSLFLQEFTKQIARDLPSDQIKKVASGITTTANEKIQEEKAAEKGGKKSKAAKSKVTLNATRETGHRADTTNYADADDDLDFM